MDGSLLTVLEQLGIFTFALSGALVGVRRDLDAFGVAVLALMTGLGGGMVRDVLIGTTPPTALSEWAPATSALCAYLVVVVWHSHIGRREQQILVADAFGLGLFCVSGTIVASEAGLGVVPAAVMGVITSIGGGIIRDLLAGRVPVVFDGDLYATPAALCALVASLAWHLDWWEPTMVVASALCIAGRLVAMRQGWGAPRPWRTSRT